MLYRWGAMPQIRTLLVPVLLGHASRHGADAASLAARAGVRFEVLDPETWTRGRMPVPIERLRVLADEVAAALDAPLLGLDVALEVPHGAYGLQEYAFRHAPSLGEAAERFVRYQRMTSDVVEHTVTRRARSTVFTTRITGVPALLGPHLNVFYVAYTMRVARELAAEEVPALAIRFPHESCAPEQLARLRAHFGTEQILFGAGCLELELGPELWDRPVAAADPGLLMILDAHAAAVLPPADPGEVWLSRVIAHLRPNLAGGPPSLAACASATGMTIRSLQRRLEEAGTTYREVLDALRQEEARRMVRETALSFDEITFLLGYADRRGFVRAFERWTGRTPTAYRNGG